MSKHTPGAWFVRTRRDLSGEIADCFVAAPSFQGDAYDSEIMGDDEYGRDSDMQRKLADAALIAAAPDLLAQHEADMTDLHLLLRAVQEGDPEPEIEMRIQDMKRRKAAVIAKSGAGGG